MFRRDPFLALFFFLYSLMIFRPFCLLPSAALFTLTIWPSSPSIPTAVEATLGALFRLERWSEYWCLPLNPSKCEASFFLVDFHQANLQLNLLLLGSHLRFNPTPTFLGVTFDYTLSFSKHASSLKAKLFPRLKALRCISASSWGPSKESFSLLYKSFLRPLLTHASPELVILPNWNPSTERPVAPSPAASRPPISLYYSPRLLYLSYESP